MRQFRRIALAALLVAGTALAAPDAADPLDALKDALARQDRYVENGQFDGLVSDARGRARDGTPESYYLLGRALGNAALDRRDHGDMDAFRSLLAESVRCFENARESGVTIYPPAYLGLARCSRLRADVALAEATAAAERNDAATQNARRATAKTEIESAITALDQALRVAPGFKAATMDLAQVLLEIGRPQDAEMIVRRQLELRPTDADLRVLLGMSHLAADKLADAEQDFRAALRAEANNAAAHKLLATVLLRRGLDAEAVGHLETYRLLRPKDEEAYRVLFAMRVKLRDREGAFKVLAAVQKELAGTQAASWAAKLEEEYRADPVKFETAEERTPQGLAKKLESRDPKAQLEALDGMRKYQWPALPGAVYQVLLPKNGAPPEVRRRALALIGDQKDPRTLSFLEVLLFHPKDQDPEESVRREVAKAIAELPSVAIVPVLWRALDMADLETREAAVRGIAKTTGKSFREKLDVVTPAEAWPRERELYDTWWRTQASAAVVRRDAMTEMTKVFGPIRVGRKRLAQYTLDSLADTNALTWRAGYDLFRALTSQSFGFEAGDVSAEERARVAQQCRDWFVVHGNEE